MCVISHTSVCSHSWLFTRSRRIHVSVPPQPIKHFTCGLVNTETPSNTSGITDRETDSLSLSLSQGKKVFPCKCQPSNSVLSFTLLRHLRGQSSKFTGLCVHHRETDSLILKHVSWLDYTHITEKHTLLFSIIMSKKVIWCQLLSLSYCKFSLVTLLSISGNLSLASHKYI